MAVRERESITFFGHAHRYKKDDGDDGDGAEAEEGHEDTAQQQQEPYTGTADDTPLVV